MSYPKEIYAIKHKITKRIYIGSTARRIEKRYLEHLYTLRKGQHPCKLMQEDYDKYGEQYDVYRLGVISNVTEKAKEYEAMIEHNTFDTRYGYNQGDKRKCRKIIREMSNPLPIKEDLSDLDEHWGQYETRVHNSKRSKWDNRT